MERIYKARARRGMSQSELSRMCGVTPSAINHLEKGNTKSLSGDLLVRMSRALDVSAEWLTSGTGTMSNSEQEAVEPGPDFVAIPRVRLRIEAGCTGYEVQQVDGNGPPIYFRRDFLDARGWKQSNLLALKVSGSSMEPALHEGDMVIINTAINKPSDGDVFVANYERQPVVKRLKRDAGDWWLMSDNADQRRYAPKRCTDDVTLIGKVVYRQTEII